MGYRAGAGYYGEFVTQNPSTGAVQPADALPSARFTRNGADDAAVVLAVSSLDAGRYSVSGTIPGTYSPGDAVQVSVSATVAGIPGKGVIDSFVLDTVPAAPLPSPPPAPVVVPAVTLGPVITTVAGGPSQVTGDAGSVSAQPLPDLVQTDRYLSQTAGRKQKKRGLMFSKIIPAGAMPDSQGTGQGGLGGFDHSGGWW